MRVLLDINVLLDSLLQHAPWNLESDEILRRAQPGVLDLAVTALSLANLFWLDAESSGRHKLVPMCDVSHRP